MKKLIETKLLIAWHKMWESYHEMKWSDTFATGDDIARFYHWERSEYHAGKAMVIKTRWINAHA